MFKPLPIGVEFFEEFKKNDYYYVDKTLFIKELIDKKGKVNLFTRPRRFGKTLTLDMLRCFFEEGLQGALQRRVRIYLDPSASGIHLLLFTEKIRRKNQGVFTDQ